MLLWVQSFWPFRAPPECLSSFPHGKSATLRGRCGRASRGAMADSVDPTECFPIKTSPQPAATYARYREISGDIGRTVPNDRTKHGKTINETLNADQLQIHKQKARGSKSPIRHFACGTVAQDTVIVQPTMMEMPSTKKLIRHDTTNQNRSTYRIGQHSIPKTSMVEVQHVAMHHPFDPPRVSTMGISLKMLHLDGQDD